MRSRNSCSSRLRNRRRVQIPPAECWDLHSGVNPSVHRETTIDELMGWAMSGHDLMHEHTREEHDPILHSCDGFEDICGNIAPLYKVRFEDFQLATREGSGLMVEIIDERHAP